MTTATAVNGDASEPSGITSLSQRRLSHLPPDTRPLPSVAVYDQLLRRHAASGKERATHEPSRHQGLTEQAADAAVDQACRMVRLPTIRSQFGNWPTPQPASRCPTAGSWPSC